VLQRQVLYLREINGSQKGGLDASHRGLRRCRPGSAGGALPRCPLGPAARLRSGADPLELPDSDQEVSAQTFPLRKDKLHIVRRREGSYLLRSNHSDEDPVALWRYYIQLTEQPSRS
jgi:hypothetical protein